MMVTPASSSYTTTYGNGGTSVTTVTVTSRDEIIISFGPVGQYMAVPPGLWSLIQEVACAKPKSKRCHHAQFIERHIRSVRGGR